MQVKLGTGPAVAHHVPAVGGWRCIVDHQGCCSALLCGLLVFVGPAAVIGHRVTLEQRRVLGGEPGVVDQDQYGLAFHIDVGVVIPAIFRRYNAVTNEHNFAGFYPGFGHHAHGSDDHFIPVFHQTVFAVHVKRHLRQGRVGLD